MLLAALNSSTTLPAKSTKLSLTLDAKAHGGVLHHLDNGIETLGMLTKEYLVCSPSLTLWNIASLIEALGARSATCSNFNSVQRTTNDKTPKKSAAMQSRILPCETFHVDNKQNIIKRKNGVDFRLIPL